MKTMNQPKSVQFRVYIRPDLDFLIRAIIPLKNMGKDWSLGEVTNEALADWLRKPENQAIVQNHNLLQALKQRGLITDIYEG